MPSWDSVIAVFAALGGMSFFWRVFDLYRDRAQVVIVDVELQTDENGHLLLVEIDNRGSRPVWISPKAEIFGRPLWQVKRAGKLVRPHLRLPISLQGERKLEASSSRTLRWAGNVDEAAPDAPPLRDPYNLCFVRWFKLRIHWTGSWRSVVYRVPQWGRGRVGFGRYWLGYLLCWIEDYRSRVPIPPDDTNGPSEAGHSQ